jgi:CHAT domain-containing protein
MDAARRTLADIEERLKALDNRLDGEFKQYAALAHPKPLSLAASQALLGPKEALLVFADAGPFPGFAPEGYAWALTSTDARWVKLPFNYLDVMRHAQALRCGLDRDGDWYWSSEKSRWLAREKWCAEVRPDGLARDEMPPFDLTRAHALYKGLLGQFEDLIKEKHLLVVPPRLMGTLPLGVLVMEPPNPALQGDDAFRSAHWLGHRQPITVLPSVSSLKILRDVARASQATRPLIGFGNPMLEGDRTNPEHAQRAKLAREKQFCAQLPAGDPQRVAKLATGERADARAIFVDGKVDVAAIRAAPPLPETADELCAVARALTAGDGDIYLGAKATKTAVMQASAYGTLARYRIVHFATHGLLAGETEWFAKGHAEPALLMTPPADGVDAEQLERDNGLLTASDVSQLQLDAEWVILSACNTASGAHTGGEALSGLARAFFYAGARALLVSHWYVDSDATVKLITRAFAELKSDPAIARSEALRRSMISLMTDTSAHPAVWAPFVVVGEGAR